MATNTYGDVIHLMTTESNDIYKELITALEENVSEPLYPGDERRIFGEALCAVWVSLFNSADDAARQTLLKYARGEVLDAIGEMFGVTRLEGAKATVELRFSVASALDFNVVIPKWTKVTPDSNVYFATDEAVVLTAGATSVTVQASATGIGEVYNGYAAGTIKTLVDLIPYISGVINITASSGGDDGEPYTEDGDDRLRARIRLAPSAFSTAGPEQAYMYWAMTADSDISDVKAFSDYETIEKTLTFYDGKAFLGGDRYVEDSLLCYDAEGNLLEEEADYSYSYNDGLLIITRLEDYEGTTIKVKIQQTMEGRVKVIPLMDGGTKPDSDTLEKVAEILDEKTVRPMTDLVTVVAPEYVEYDIEFCYYCEPDTESAVIATVETVGGAVDQYNAWQQAKLGRDINPDQLRRYILRPDWADNLKAPYRVDVVSPTHVEVSETQVAHWSGTLKVTHVTTIGGV